MARSQAVRKPIQAEKPIKRVDGDPDPFDVAVGARLRLALRAAGIKQSRVVEDCGVGQTTLSNYVRGERPLPGKLAHQLREKYSITADWLYSGDWTGLPARIHEKLSEAA